MSFVYIARFIKPNYSIEPPKPEKRKVKQIMNKKISCPECGAEFEVPDDLMLREVVTCPDCGLELEVKEISEDHVIVEKIILEREDWGE